MSTIIGQSQRSIAELMELSSYSEMTDDEIEHIINYKINQAVTSIENAYRNRDLLRDADEREKILREYCESNAKALKYMCEQRVEPTPLVINKLEFHPMEFSNE